jgi:hypothetical protein
VNLEDGERKRRKMMGNIIFKRGGHIYLGERAATGKLVKYTLLDHACLTLLHAA